MQMMSRRDEEDGFYWNNIFPVIDLNLRSYLDKKVFFWDLNIQKYMPF